MRYKATIEYDGTNLLGWQRQLDGLSAQECLETAISQFMGYTPLSRQEYAQMKEEKNVEASTDECPQISISNSSKTVFNEENEGISTERRPATYIGVREEASTGECPQVSISNSSKTAFNEENEGISTERRPATYIGVREEASTGECPQVSIKNGFYPVQCAGRTDAGVHALAQVVHFDLDRDYEEWKLREGINAHLRNANAPLSILQIEIVDNDFNARFSATGRGYIYRILNRRAFPVIERNRVWWVPYPLDVERMRQGAQYLLGYHDFSSFRAAACQAKTPFRTIDKIEIIQEKEEIRFIIEAKSFLHHQVRNIVGTLKIVGDGKLQPEDIKTILEAKNRKAAGPTAPACGLYLSKVTY